jgi:DNA replication protein DnaD
MKSTKKSLGISELIRQIKEDLLSEQGQEDPKLFSIDEITLELNFTVSGDIDSGFNLGVVTLGSEISEERVQKITLKLTPLVSKTQLLEQINSSQEDAAGIVEASQDGLLKGTLNFK